MTKWVYQHGGEWGPGYRQGTPFSWNKEGLLPCSWLSDFAWKWLHTGKKRRKAIKHEGVLAILGKREIKEIWQIWTPAPVLLILGKCFIYWAISCYGQVCSHWQVSDLLRTWKREEKNDTIHFHRQVLNRILLRYWKLNPVTVWNSKMTEASLACEDYG